jgi:hypothetical protein
MKYFDYVFFRIYSYYLKKKYIPLVMGIGFLFVLKYCLLFLVATIINVFTDNIISADFIGRNTFYFSYWAIITAFAIADVFRYGQKEKINNNKGLFSNSPLNSKIPTWLIFIQPFIVLIVSFLIIELVKQYNDI